MNMTYLASVARNYESDQSIGANVSAVDTPLTVLVAPAAAPAGANLAYIKVTCSVTIANENGGSAGTRSASLVVLGTDSSAALRGYAKVSKNDLGLGGTVDGGTDEVEVFAWVELSTLATLQARVTTLVPAGSQNVRVIARVTVQGYATANIV
jgi:hypothetical protein